MEGVVDVDTRTFRQQTTPKSVMRGRRVVKNESLRGKSRFKEGVVVKTQSRKEKYRIEMA